MLLILRIRAILTTASIVRGPVDRSAGRPVGRRISRSVDQRFRAGSVCRPTIGRLQIVTHYYTTGSRWTVLASDPARSAVICDTASATNTAYAHTQTHTHTHTLARARRSYKLTPGIEAMRIAQWATYAAAATLASAVTASDRRLYALRTPFCVDYGWPTW